MSRSEPGVWGLGGWGRGAARVENVTPKGGIIAMAEIKMHNLRAVSFGFIWGLTEDCTPGDSLSASSEKLLQRGGRQVSIGVILKKRAIQHTSRWTVAASHEKQIS